MNTDSQQWIKGMVDEGHEDEGQEQCCGSVLDPYSLLRSFVDPGRTKNSFRWHCFPTIKYIFFSKIIVLFNG